MFALLKEAGLEVDQSKDRPDFIITKPYKFNIEAVVANIKRKGKQEKERNLQDQLGMLLPPRLQKDFIPCLNESITRYSNAIQSKNKLYINNYSKCNWINDQDPFVVALGSYDQINYGREFIYPMMALLFGMYYNPLTNEYERKEKIKKPNSDSDIEIGIFNKKEYENISAIIYSCTVTLGKLTAMSISQEKVPSHLNKVFTIRHDIDDKDFPYKMQIVSKDIPEFLSDGVFIFHNPNAKYKLPVQAFENTNAVQVIMDKTQIHFNGDNLPIITRFSTPLISDEFLKLL